MVIEVNTSAPVVHIAAVAETASQTSLPSFNINIQKLRETDSNGDDVVVFDLLEANFTYLQASSTNSSVTWEYSSKLENQAVVNITVSHSKEVI